MLVGRLLSGFLCKLLSLFTLNVFSVEGRGNCEFLDLKLFLFDQNTSNITK
jgi:hypothetical protein